MNLCSRKYDTPEIKRKTPATNMQRTLAMYRKQGYLLAIVEKFNKFVPPHGVRQDLFGFGDILGLGKGEKCCTMFQTCRGADHAEHKAKILSERRAQTWLDEGQRILLVSWSKKGARGQVKKWDPRIEEITVKDFETAAPF